MAWPLIDSESMSTAKSAPKTGSMERIKAVCSGVVKLCANG